MAKQNHALGVHRSKKSEKPPGTSGAPYRLLFEKNRQPMFVYDVQSLAFLAVNQAALDLYGYSREEFLRMTVRDLPPPEDLPSTLETLKRAADLVERRVRRRHRKKNGALIDIETLSNHCDWEGRPARLVTIEDITERKQIEESLRQSEEYHRLLVEQSPDAMLVHRGGTIIFANRGAIGFFGASSADELLGTQILDSVHPDHREAVKQRIKQFGSDPVSVRRNETRFLRRDGGEVYAEVAARTIIYHGEAATQVMFRDVSGRKTAEEELRRSEARLAAAQAIAHVGDWSWDILEDDLTWSAEMFRIYGVSPQEFDLKPASVVRLIHPGDVERHEQLVRDLLAGKSVAPYEYRIIRPDGEERVVQVLGGTVERDGAGAPVRISGVVLDVTAQRALERQLLLAQKMEAIGQLSGGIAHDFNNLLSVIIGYSEVLEERIPQSDPLRKNCEQIANAGRSAASLTRQLLAFSRQQVLEPKVLDLSAVVRHVEEMLRRLIGEHIELTTALNPTLGRVKADQGQIEQVIMNLAINARDAMPNGGKLTIETTDVELDEEYARGHPLQPPGQYVLLTVSDTGVGMDAETQAHIFEPFFTTKEVGKGTGLGLATVYGVVKQSGGFIWLYSEVGHGTTFKIYLPRTTEAVGADKPASPTQLPRGGSETILLVEDEAALLEFTATVLTHNGYAVLTAERADKAIEIARQHQGPIDLLLTDVIMPGMNGRELAQKLSAIRPETGVVYMSGYTGFTQPGVVDSNVILISKPFTREELLQKVREGLELVAESKPN